MLKNISIRLADRLIKCGAINADHKEICIYGFQLLISSLFSTSLVLSVGIGLGKFPETAAFLIVYILLRSYSGGYHANSYAVCTIVTLFVYFSVILLATFVNVNISAYLSLFLVGVVLLFLLAPINSHKEIFSTDARRYKIISLILFSVFVGLGMVWRAKNISIGNAVFYSLCADLINLFALNAKK